MNIIINMFLHIIETEFTSFIFSVAFHIETSHLICIANQMTGFYMECNTGLKSVNFYCGGASNLNFTKKKYSHSFYGCFFLVCLDFVKNNTPHLFLCPIKYTYKS